MPSPASSFATETSLFDQTPATVEESAPHIENVMVHSVYDVLDQAVKGAGSSLHPKGPWEATV